MNVIFSDDQNESLGKISEIFSVSQEDVVSKFRDYLNNKEQQHFLTMDMVDNTKIRIPYEKWVDVLSQFSEDVLKPIFQPVYQDALNKKKKGKR